MAWRFEVQIDRTLRLWRWRARRISRRFGTKGPAGLNRSALTLSIIFHLAVAGLLLSFAPIWEPRGLPDAPDHAINVYIIPPPPEPGAAPAPEIAQIEEAEAPEAEQVAETVPEQSPEAVAEVTTSPPSDAPRIRAPSSVRVPEVDLGEGAPDGIVGLECYREFDDPRLAAECAGAPITSDWRQRLEGSRDAQWAKAEERLRTGRYRGPFAVGPDRYGDLGENEQLYQPRDPRFNVGPGPSTGGSGANYAAAFESEEEYRKYLALYDSRMYRGDNDHLNDTYSRSWGQSLTGWRPSWQLREDPAIDGKALEQFLKEVEDQ